MDTHHGVPYRKPHRAQQGGADVSARGLRMTPANIRMENPEESAEIEGSSRMIAARRNYGRNQSDPIQRLPAELFTAVILYALGSHSNYTPQLILYTHVSQLWGHFLMSTPVLWSELHVDEETQDLWATVAVSVHLSGKVALKLCLWNLPLKEMSRLSSMLLTIRQRITRLHLDIAGLKPRRWEEHTRSSYEELQSTAFSIISSLLDRLDRFPRLGELSLDPPRALDMSRVFRLNFLPNLRIPFKIEVQMPPNFLKSVTADRFFDINKYKFLPSIVDISHLVSMEWENVYDDHRRIAILTKGERTLSDLRCVADQLVGCSTLERFTRIAASCLCVLEVKLKLGQREDLVGFLQELACLQKLNLTIIVSKGTQATKIHPSGTVIRGFKDLIFYLEYDNRPDLALTQELLEELFSAFTAMYPAVERLSFRTGGWLIFASGFLQNSNALKYLNLHDSSRHNPPIRSIKLPVLAKLDVGDTHWCHSIEAPHLLSLTIDDVDRGSKLSGLNLRRIRKLEIRCSDERVANIHPMDYPYLRELDLNAWGGLNPVDISLFLHLSSIYLYSAYFTNPEAIRIIMALLRHPEGCLSLEEIGFNGTVEWDLLFLMLERRNFDLKGIKRIHTVSPSFVPPHIRQFLNLLLLGEPVARPELISLSLEETRAVLFDPTVPGCFPCLKSMWPGCMEQVHPRIGGDMQDDLGSDERHYQEVHRLFPEYKAVPSRVSKVVGNWLSERRQLVNIWAEEYEEFTDNYLRSYRCDRHWS